MSRTPVALAAVVPVLILLGGCSASIQPLRGEKDLRYEIENPGFWEEVESVARLTKGAEPAPAVCWLSDGRTAITYDSGNFTTTESRRVKLVVLDAGRAEPYLNVAIPTSSSHPVSNIRARTILSDGTCVHLDSDDIHERSRFPEYVLYADQKEVVFAMPAVEDRCVVEYEYVRSSGGVNFEDHFSLSMPVPVKKASYTFSMPMDLVTYGVNVNTKVYGAPAIPEHGKAVSAEGELSTLTWTRELIPAIAYEPYMPSQRDAASRIAVGLKASPSVGVYTWNKLGRDYFESTLRPLIAGSRTATVAAGLPSVAIEWCGGAKTASEKVEAIGNAVADKIRYVAIGLEDSGWTPQHPSSTLSSRYGDCKDMSVLTCALLHSLGVEAWPALLATRSVGVVDTAIVTPSLMNHMIVYARTSSGDCWVDPTGGVFELGELPSEDRDVLALVLTDKKCFFRRVPDSRADANRIETRVKGKLNPDGSFGAELVMEYRGDPALALRGTLDRMSPEEARKALERFLRDDFGDVTVTSSKCFTSGEPRPCRIVAEFECDRLAQRAGSSLIIAGSTFGPERFEGQLPQEQRWNDVVFDHAYTSTESFELELPTGWRPDELPKGVDVESDYGSFTSHVAVDGRVFRSERTFCLSKSKVNAAFYSRLRRFFGDAESAASVPVVLTRG